MRRKQAADAAKELQGLLFHCLALTMAFRQYHWNVRGTMFKPLHDFLGEGYAMLDGLADDLAERMTAKGEAASSQIAGISAVAKSIPVAFVSPPKVVERLTTDLDELCGRFRSAISATEDDVVTSNMLQDMTHKLEKYLWMLRSQSESAETATKTAAHRAVTRICKR